MGVAIPWMRMREITWGKYSQRAGEGLGLSLAELKYLEAESRNGTSQKNGEGGASEREENVSECVVIESMKGKKARRDWSTVFFEVKIRKGQDKERTK